ncbi:hypothetical protein M422DRAFT_256966 [Sphaerobolus stellatus SS14]|uniref:Uncharacterized protein n=1 Tax=Sphaerobolus stellatus (strain SS14) TaxID=990650 RepID=A0A0C9VPP7_SPHS4|nr:hypothetical protein M422DRAFT_256966 [Sphaerobolus stellatus SS14]
MEHGNVERQRGWGKSRPLRRFRRQLGARRCGAWLCPSDVITAALCHITSTAVPSASAHPSEEDGRVWLCVRHDATAHRLSTFFLQWRHLANLALRSLHFESIDSFVLSLSCDLPIKHTDAFLDNTSIIQYWILDCWNLGRPLEFRGMEATKRVQYVHYIEDKLRHRWKYSDYYYTKAQLECEVSLKKPRYW